MAKVTGYNYSEHITVGDSIRELHVYLDVPDVSEVARIVANIKSMLAPPTPVPTLQVVPEVPPVAPEQPTAPPPVPTKEVVVMYQPPAKQATPAEPPVSPEVDRTDLSEQVVFLFEEDCKGVKTVQDATQVWHAHAGAIRKLQEPYKQRCSNTLSMRLAESMNIEPTEAKELIKAALSRPKTEAAPKVPLTQVRQEFTESPKEPLQKPVEAPSGAGSIPGDVEFFASLAKEPKVILGAAVKVACAQLKEGDSVSASLVEKFLVSLVGKHPMLTSADEITAITRSSRMKLYASAAKTKLTE